MTSRSHTVVGHYWPTPLIFFLLILFLLIVPICKFPIKDEGGYFRMAMDLPEYGLNIYPAFDMTSTSLSVLIPGYLALSVLGKTLFVARAFVLIVSVLGLLWCVRLLRRLGADATSAALFAAIVAVNPLFSRYAHIFTTDTIFLTLGQLCLFLYAIGVEEKKATSLGLGTLAGALAIYTKQPGLILPMVPVIVMSAKFLTKRELPSMGTLLLLVLPYLAFLPLALFFYTHSGSFFMYVSKPWEHKIEGIYLSHALWSINFLGFFSAPFLYPVLKGHWSILRSWRGTPLIVSIILAPSILASPITIASDIGGIGRIFSALHLPNLTVLALVLICQFSGLITLAILVVRAFRAFPIDKYLLIFSLLYMALLSAKGGNLLVHYATPMIPAAAWVVATAYRDGRCGFRWIYPVLILLVAAFSFVWAAAESALGEGIHRGIAYIEENRAKGDMIYTWSSSALQTFERTDITFEPSKANYILMTPEDAHRTEPPEDFSVVREFPISLLGRSLGRVSVYRRPRKINIPQKSELLSHPLLTLRDARESESLRIDRLSGHFGRKEI